MIDYNERSKNTAQKTFLIILEIIIIVVSYLLMFAQLGVNIFGTPVYNIQRASLIFTFNIILFITYLYTILFSVKRKITWDEALSIPLAFAIYYIGFALLVYKQSAAISFIDYVGIAVFVSGVIIHLWSEIEKNRFKSIEENKGKLLTKGWWGIIRHPNYFADLLWVSGYAIVTHNPWSWVIVAYLFVFFYFYNIPLQEKHLSEKYTEQFSKYKKSTKALIPFIL